MLPASASLALGSSRFPPAPLPEIACFTGATPPVNSVLVAPAKRNKKRRLHVLDKAMLSMFTDFR
jgi:hypothetical protein